MDPQTLSTDGKISLTCLYSGTTTGAINWYYKGKIVASDDRMVMTEMSADKWEYKFILTEVNPELHAGTYKCELSFEDTDQIDTSTEVTVCKTSIISKAGESIESMIIGEDELKMRCMIEADVVPINVVWFKGDDEITFDGNTKIMNYNTVILTNSIRYMSNVTLKNFAFTDAGDYTCKADFGDSAEMPESAVTVVYAAVNSDGCVFVDYLNSQETTISCTFRGMEAAQNVKFILPNSEERMGDLGQLTENSGQLSSQIGSLILIGVNNEIDGSYRCEFTLSGGGTVSTHQQLTARSKLIYYIPV